MTTSSHSPGAGFAPLLVEPPWARVSHVQLFRREIREFLSASALEVLFSYADQVVEGSRELGANTVTAGGRTYATVMVTIDLRKVEGFFREPADEATAERVAELMDIDGAPIRRRLIKLARSELARLAGVEPNTLEVALEHHVRCEGTRVLIDGDAMATIVARRRR